MLTVGSFRIQSVVTGTFRLDGGAMFGVVPKALWSNKMEADELNRIPLAARALLAVDRESHRIVVVDTGCGTKWDAKEAERFAIRHNPDAIVDSLRSIGRTAADVTDVVVTHLHFDHNGGLSVWAEGPGGDTRLCFPRASHWIHRRQWDHAHSPSAKDRASYLPIDFAALERSETLRFVEGDEPEPPFPGMEWLLSHGHTPYQLHPIFRVGTEKLVFTGDIVPTLAHLRTTWVMAYDLFPLTTISEKETLFRRGIEEGLRLAFPHDPEVGGVAIAGTVDRPIVTRTLEL